MDKRCRDCGEVKPFEAFYPKSGREQYRNSAAGYSHACKRCTITSTAEYRNNNPKKAKSADDNSRLKRVYGIDLVEYNRMFAAQGGCCAGCKRHQSELKFKLAVDHCHSSGIIRGLLCISCNAALGNVKDDIEILDSLITYLTKFSESAANKMNTDMKVG